MDVSEIFELNPSSECKVWIVFREEWKNCYYQLTNEKGEVIDPNLMPLLDDKYLNDTGEPLYNDDNKEVFDSNREIYYDTYYEVEQYEVYQSKSFISSLQNKVKYLIESGDLTEDSDSEEVREAFEMIAGWGPSSLGGNLLEGIDDLVLIEKKNGYDDLLWCTSSQLDEEETYFAVEEL